MLAVGPMAILPSPLLATIPTVLTTNQSINPDTAGLTTIIQTAGTGNLTNTTTTADISVSDKSILVWTRGTFNIGSTEAYNFTISNNGSVLNRVGYTVGGQPLASKDDVTIAGNLTANGRVFLLVNGNVILDGSARISTDKGFVVSTVNDTSADFNFSNFGNLSTTGTSNGNITIGNATASTTVAKGNLEAMAGAITLDRVNFLSSGDLILRTVTAGQAIDVGANGPVTVTGGNISITTNNGAITDTNATSTISANNISLSTGGSAAITLDNASNLFTSVAVSTVGGAATIVDSAGGIVIATSNLGTGNLTVTTTGAISTNGAVTANLASLTGSGDINFGSGSVVSLFNATTSAGSITFTGNSNAVTYGTISDTGGGTISLTNSGSATINGTISTSSNVAVTATSITTGSAGVVALGTTGVVNYNATNGGISLGAVTANAINAVATGSISQVGTTVLTTPNSTSTFTTGTGAGISLTNNNVLDGSTVTLVGGSATIVNTQPIIIGSANLTGSLSINTVNSTAADGNVTLGAGSGTASANIQVGGGLTIATNGSRIDDDDDLTIRVFGPVNLSTATSGTPNPAGQTGNITLNSASGSSGRGSASFGQITANSGNQGNVTIVENQTINFGTVTANVLSGNSVSGSILFSGQVTANAVSANANTAGISQTSALNITSVDQSSFFRSSNSSATVLDNPSNVFNTGTGAVRLVNGGNNIIVANSGLRLAEDTATNNLTVNTTATGTAGTVRFVQNNATTGVSGNNIVINSAGPITVESTSAIRNLTLNTTDSTASSIASASNGALQVNGTLTLQSPGNITLRGNVTVDAAGLPTGGGGTLGTNVTGTVILNNVTGNVALVNQRNMTLTGTANNVTATAGFGPFASQWNLNLGNLNVGNLTAQSVVSEGANFNTVSLGSSGNVAQVAGSNVHVENRVQLISFNGGNIVVGNNGNSFGRVEAFTGGSIGATTNNSGNITIVEDSTLKVGNIITGGNASLTSRFGSIIEDTVLGSNLTVGGVLSLNAANGSILVGGTTNAGTTFGAVSSFNVTAPSGAVAVQSSGNVTLGATAANSLSVRSGGNISQSGALSIFGLATFNATNNITLENTANNFGPLVLISSAGNISIAEAGTLNLRTVTQAGGSNVTFTANSVNGDIIDTGLGGVRPGGLVGNPGTGIVNLVAINGNIIIDDPTTDFPTQSGIAFNAKNVTLSVLGSGTSATPLNLGAAGTTSVATGNLVASSALGNISNMGNMTVGGNAFFQTGAGNISINQSGNRFGSIRFVGNTVTIVEADDTVINTGSSAIGQASITSGGNITIANTGGGSVTFGNTVSMIAAGTITLPKLIQAVGTLSVNAPGTKDLSALSISGDLSGKSPFNGGSGSYLPPQP